MKHVVELCLMETTSVTVEADSALEARELVSRAISAPSLPRYVGARAGATAVVAGVFPSPEGYGANSLPADGDGTLPSARPISVREVRQALLSGVARVVDAERFGGTGPCCLIGEDWFYFDGDWDSRLDDDEIDGRDAAGLLSAYLSSVTVEEAAESIADELAELRRYSPAEWSRYRALLCPDGVRGCPLAG